MTEIILENVSQHFEAKGPDRTRIRAVQDVSLKVKPGGSLALLGPTGCGKTTLLRLIAGLDKPASGRVLYDGEPLDALPLQERGIGMVFQDYALIPHWNAQRTISFFLRLRHREREVPERVRRVSRITGIGIDALMDKRPAQLSGGEKQRVAIARAFARDLEVLLLDEPFASLDAKFRATARIELKRLLSEFPVTTIMVTHDQQEASSLVERIAVMKDGQIVQTAPYRHLYAHPHNLFVGQFIGVPVMNRLVGTARAGKWYGAAFGGFDLPTPVADATLVVAGVRPDAIQPGPGGVRALVEHVEAHFAERYTLLSVRCGEERWQMQAALEDSYRVGDAVHCVADPARVLYFDAASGSSLTPFVYDDDL